LEVWGLSKRNVQVIENMVDPPSFHNSGDSVLRLVFIGRLENEKGPKLFLELAQILKIPALIIGEGTLKNELRNYSNLHHIDVKYMNFQSNPWASFSRGDLLVVPSTWEGDGLIVVEAILAKIPLIVNDIYAFRRFELNAISYANSLESFRDRIQSCVDDLQKFVPPESSFLNLQTKRSPSRLLNLWIQLMDPK
jgi:glycosyltransferase involved in cell wall biosynthesis